MSRGRIPPPPPTANDKLTPIPNKVVTEAVGDVDINANTPNKSIYEKLSARFEDAIVKILTPFVYIGVILLIVVIGIAESGELLCREYPLVKKWIAEKLSHIYYK